jgi:hypothetical protein
LLNLLFGYAHVDVFASHAYAGNSLAVFLDSRGLNSGHMLSITQELRHFESIFLEGAPKPNRYRARIFAPPIVRAASVLGSGVQAYWQVLALYHERPFEVVRI